MKTETDSHSVHLTRNREQAATVSKAAEDRELLRLAAIAEGTVYQDPSIACVYRGGPVFLRPSHGANYQWDPLIDNADAFELAVKLRLHIDHARDSVDAWAFQSGKARCFEEDASNDAASTRRAIVRAAASVGAAIEADLADMRDPWAARRRREEEALKRERVLSPHLWGQS